MISSALTKQIRKKIQLYEGNVPHMYLDSKGYVTVGIGSLISSVATAQKLPFVHDKTLKKATANEIKTDFDNINKQKADELETYYKKYTKLILTQPNITKLFNKQIHLFYKDLSRLYTKFDNYPIEVKLALFDMIYNMGMTTLRREFLKFNIAIIQKDWLTAAQESHRKRPIKTPRNNYVKNLLQMAANKQSQTKNP